MSHWTSPADFFPLKISLTIRQSSFRNLRNDLEKLRHNSWRQRRPQKAGRSDEISSKDCEVFECSAVTFGHSVYKLYRCCFIEFLMYSLPYNRTYAYGSYGLVFYELRTNNFLESNHVFLFRTASTLYTAFS